MDDYDSYIENMKTSASARNYLALDNNPDDAAEALDLSNDTGIPATAIRSDLDGFKRTHKATLGSQIINDNANIAAFINSHPLAADVSHDDLGVLDTVSGSLDKLMEGSAFGKWLKDDSIARSFVTAARGMVGGFEKGFGEEPVGQRALGWGNTERPNDIEYTLSHPLIASIGSIPAFAGELMSRTARGVMGVAQGELEPLDKIFGAGFSRDLLGMAEWRMTGAEALGTGAAGPVKLGEMQSWSKERVQRAADEVGKEILSGADPTKTIETFKQASRALEMIDLYRDAGLEVPAYVHPIIDKAKELEAKEDIAKLDDSLAEALKSSTRERSPELFAQFMRQHVGDREIGLDAEAVRKLYGDKVPVVDDGVLGWISDLDKQLANADITGQDIVVPMADWLAKVDKEVAKQLHDDTRVRASGLTLNETKIDAPPKEVISDPVAALRGQAGLEPQAMVGDRKLQLQKKPVRNLEQIAAEKYGPNWDRLSEADQLHYMDIVGDTITSFKADEFRILDESGNKVGDLEGTPMNDGKRFYVDGILGFESLGFGPNSFGPTLMRDLIKQLKDHYPQLEEIGGFRVSGARGKADTARDVWIKVQPDGADAGYHQKMRNLLSQNWEHVGQGSKALFDLEGTGLAADTPMGSAVLSELHRIAPTAESDVAHAVKVGGREVWGAHIPNLRQIIVALTSDDPLGTARHEAIHHLRDSGLISDKEWSTLNDAVKSEGWRDKYQIDERWAKHYLDLPDREGKLNEEAIAEGYRKWAAGAAMPKEVATTFQKIKDFFEGLRQRMLEFMGIEHDLSWEQIFEKIDSGEIGSREFAEEGGGAEAAMAELTDEQKKQALYERAAARSRTGQTAEQLKQKQQAGLKGLTEGTDRRATLKPDEEPQAMAEEKPPGGLYERGKDLGITQSHMDRMLSLIERRNKEDLAAAQRRAEVKQRRRSNLEWKERRTQLRDEVREALSQRPDIASDSFFTKAGLKLHPDYLSEEQRSRLPKDYVQKKNGVNPDDVAGQFGYSTGDALVERLAMLAEDRTRAGLSQRDYFNRLVDIETDRRLNREFGDREQTIRDEARDQAVSETQLNLVHEETLAHALKAGMEPKFTRADMTEMVQNVLRDTPVKQLSFERIMQKAGAIGKKIEEAAAKGKWDEAYRLSQQRESGLILAKFAKDYEKARRQFDKNAKGLAKDRTRASIDQPYLNWIHDILSRTGFGLRRSIQDLQENIGRQEATTLADFIDKEQKFNGLRQLDVADFLQDPAYRKKVDDMTHWEFEGLRQSIKILEKAGRDEKTVNVGGEAWDRIKLRQALTERLQTFGYSPVKAEIDKSRLKPLRYMVWGLTATETWLNRLDRNDPKGLFNRTFVYPLSRAADGKAAMQRDAAKRIAAAGYPDAKLLQKLVDAPFPDPRTPDGLGKWEGFNYGNVLMMLQNVGNESNAKVLFRGLGMDPVTGFKWLEKQVRAEDVIRAQAIGDVYKTYMKQADKVYERLTGATVEKIPIKQITFNTRDGPVTVDGWYHPLDADPTRSSMWKTDAETGERTRTARRQRGSAMDEANFFHASTSNGYTKKRTGAVYPVSLDYGLVNTRLQQIIHDINFREPILNAEKIFADRLFKEDVGKYYGQEYAEDMRPYLQRLAGAEGISYKNIQDGNRFLEKFRQNIISTYIWGNPMTMGKHGPTALVFSSNEVGKGAFAKAFAQSTNWLFMHPEGVELQKKIHDMSETIQRRDRHWQDTLGGQALKFGAEPTTREKMIEIGSKGVAWSDKLSSYPTFWAKYQQELAAGTDFGLARDIAERSVRRAHGSTAETNQPPWVAMGGPLNRYLTSVYGFFGTAMQRRIELGHQLNDMYHLVGDKEYAAAARNGVPFLKNFFTYMVWPTLVEEAVMASVTDDHRTGLQRLASGVTYGLSSTFLYLRDFFYGTTTGHDPGVGLLSSVSHDAANVVRDLTNPKKALSKQHIGQTVEDVVTVLGEATGKAPKIAGRAAHFAIDVATGQQKPKTPIEWMRGVAHGHAQRKAHH